MDRKCMETQYWDLMVDLRFQIWYCEKYEHHLKLIDGWLTGIALFVSSAAIANWAIWQVVGMLWAFLIAAGQVLQLVKPLLPFSQRLVSLRFYLPELRILAVNSEYHWNCRSKLSNEEFATVLLEDKKSAVTLETKYVGANTIPRIKKLSDKAWEETKLFMLSFESCTKGDETLAE